MLISTILLCDIILLLFLLLFLYMFNIFFYMYMDRVSAIKIYYYYYNGCKNFLICLFKSIPQFLVQIIIPKCLHWSTLGISNRFKYKQGVSILIINFFIRAY